MINFVLQALDGIFTIVFVVGIGYVLSKKGWFDDNGFTYISIHAPPRGATKNENAD